MNGFNAIVLPGCFVSYGGVSYQNTGTRNRIFKAKIDLDSQRCTFEIEDEPLRVDPIDSAFEQFCEDEGLEDLETIRSAFIAGWNSAPNH